MRWGAMILAAVVTLTASAGSGADSAGTAKSGEVAPLSEASIADFVRRAKVSTAARIAELESKLRTWDADVAAEARRIHPDDPEAPAKRLTVLAGVKERHSQELERLRSGERYYSPPLPLPRGRAKSGAPVAWSARPGQLGRIDLPLQPRGLLDDRSALFAWAELTGEYAVINGVEQGTYEDVRLLKFVAGPGKASIVRWYEMMTSGMERGGTSRYSSVFRVVGPDSMARNGKTAAVWVFELVDEKPLQAAYRAAGQADTHPPVPR